MYRQAFYSQTINSKEFPPYVVEIRSISMFLHLHSVLLTYKKILSYDLMNSLQIIFRSKQIHRNNKTRLYKTLIKPILCYGSVTWTLAHTAEQMLNTFERKILRRICGPTQVGETPASQMEQ